jgi:hypothetical protein
VVKAGTHLAGAITAAFLLAGVGCAAAAADTNADSAESENRNSSASDRGPKAAEHSTNAHRKADKAVDSSDTKKKPVNHDHGTGERPGDKAIDTVPLRPEAPVDVVPLPQAPPALDAPPPADLPPIVPATPVDPDTLDSVTGEGGHGEIEPPVLTVPVLVAPAPIPPVRILGASIAQRGATGGRTVDPPPQSPGEPAPQMLRAPADGASAARSDSHKLRRDRARPALSDRIQRVFIQTAGRSGEGSSAGRCRPGAHDFRRDLPGISAGEDGSAAAKPRH